jgi:hypothetical protein
MRITGIMKSNLGNAVLLLLGLGGGVVSAEISATNHPFPGISIFSESRSQPPTRLFVAVVDLLNPNLRLRVAPGGPDPDGDGPWQTTLMRPSRIAEREGMALVVNGDFFRARGVKDAEGTNAAFRAEIWSAVLGPAVSAGKVWAVTTNGRPCLTVDDSNRVAIRRLAQPDADLREVVAGNTLLVRSGVALSQTNQVRHPRTVVGLDKKREHLVLLVVDGRKPGVAVGMSYEELAGEMIRLGCHDALNLDGGGSSVMAVRESATNGFKILNQPTDGRERPVANVLGVTFVPSSAPTMSPASK